MRSYLITLLVIAFLVGTLFKASEQTGMRIWNMYAVMGIFLFGLIGSLGLSRMQQQGSARHVETELKRLEAADWVITDWSGEAGPKPDYLLVGPTGLAAVCVDQTAGSAFQWRARRLIERSRQRAKLAGDWVRTHLRNAPASPDLPVLPVLLLARRRTQGEYSADGVAVLNPDQLAGCLGSGGAFRLDRPDRVKITRFFRELSGA